MISELSKFKTPCHQSWYIAEDLHCKYLVTPLCTKKLTLLQWQPLIDKIVKIISTCTTKQLFYVGKL